MFESVTKAYLVKHCFPRVLSSHKLPSICFSESNHEPRKLDVFFTSEQLRMNFFKAQFFSQSGTDDSSPWKRDSSDVLKIFKEVKTFRTDPSSLYDEGRSRPNWGRTCKILNNGVFLASKDVVDKKATSSQGRWISSRKKVEQIIFFRLSKKTVCWISQLKYFVVVLSTKVKTF